MFRLQILFGIKNNSSILTTFLLQVIEKMVKLYKVKITNTGGWIHVIVYK